MAHINSGPPKEMQDIWSILWCVNTFKKHYLHWLGPVFTPFPVPQVTIIGFTLGIPDVIMGITFLAAGTSVPDCMASLIVARQGQSSSSSSSSSSISRLHCQDEHNSPSLSQTEERKRWEGERWESQTGLEAAWEREGLQAVPLTVCTTAQQHKSVTLP